MYKEGGCMERFRIVYEDEYLFVLWKSAGVPVQSARASVPDVMSLLRNRLLERGEKSPYLGLIHRLDQPVEGLFLVARQERAAADLSRQVQEHVHMEKQYQALVCGKLPGKEGSLVDHLQKDSRTNLSRVVPEGTKGAKRCELSYEVLEEKDGICRLKIRLLTGRHHQIRVQLAHAGCPILGDRKYGKADAGVGDFGLALCACGLTFVHPKTKEKMCFSVEPTFLKEFPAGTDRSGGLRD